MRDIAFPRTSAFRQEQIEIKFKAGFSQENDTPEVRARVRDMIIENDRAMEALGYLQDVDTFLDQYQVEKSTTTVGRYIAAGAFRVAGPLHQLVNKNTMYL